MDFALIFGTPISGYHAPEQVTMPPARRVFEVILGVLMEAHQAGALAPLPVPENLELQLPGVDLGPHALPVPVLHLGLVGWTRIHGMILLELFHHIQPMVADTAAFYQSELEQLVRNAGLQLEP